MPGPSCNAVSGRGHMPHGAILQHGEILHGDNLPLLKAMPSESVTLVYIDPPFNTGKTQSRMRIKTKSVTDAAAADRTGFGGRHYQTTVTIPAHASGYADSFEDYPGFLRPRLQQAHRILTPNGSLFFHIDWRESARCRLLLEDIFGGGAHCINEIIWAYDFGARSKKKWPAKHDNIYWFAKDPANYIFHYAQIDRIPYLAPGLAGAEKAARGKTPTDTWWQTIVPTNGREKTNYPTQKPLRILERIVRVHSHPGDIVLDFFAGSGTTGEAALRNGRRFVLIDQSREAVRIAKKRLAAVHQTGKQSEKSKQCNTPQTKKPQAQKPQAGKTQTKKIHAGKTHAGKTGASARMAAPLNLAADLSCPHAHRARDKSAPAQKPHAPGVPVTRCA